ncbi:MAG: adenylate/guanylate cyclase domain-containing protein [Treponema sp.]|nr:adenylate/guanylate cyclase domain-containing protein [Treponema sp.]
MKKKTNLGKKIVALIIIGIIFIVTSGLHLLGVFNFLEYKSYDLRVRLMAGYTRASNDIIVILLDQHSLDWAQQERGWGWPWPRQAYAEVVNYMNLGGANSIAFDVLFSEPSVYRNAKQDEIIDNAVRSLQDVQVSMTELQRGTSGETPRGTSGETSRGGSSIFNIRNIMSSLYSLSAREDDASFTRASQNYGKVVQAVFFSSKTGSALTWPNNLNKPLFQPERFDSMLNYYSIGEGTGAQFPIQELRESAGALGSVTGTADSDGIIRRLKPFTLFDGKAVPGLSVASLMVSGIEPQITYNKKKNLLEWGNYSIPVNSKGEALLRYRGSLEERYFPYYAMDILQSAEAYEKGEEPLLPPDNFEGAYVFFGFYAPGLYDIFSSPISSLYPGMGCHITMLDNLLQRDFNRESAMWVNLLILLAVVGLIVCLTMFSNRLSLTIGGTIIIVVVIITGAFIAYLLGGLWVPMVTYLIGIFAAFITVTLYNYATEGSQKRFIKSAFSQYLSPKVIEQIIQDPSQLKLGGEKREMTAIFTDIRAFSTFSEALGDPSKLVELLNFYLTKMSNIVLENQGTIDKYEGDAIIAFFGAPVHMSNHASLACRAVVKMKKAEVEINREALAQGFLTPKVLEALAAKGATKSVDDPCPIFTRLGVNTGDMVVGNMGTPNKMDYTIMGNAVNLAARLEGVNKQYHTGGILISEYTQQKTGDEFIVRPLSRVRVVGINTPLRLYELLDIAGEAPPQLLEMVENWKKAFDLYEKRDFTGAQNIFQTIYNNNNSDLTAKMYLTRCRKCIASPPDDETWDNGVDNLTEK